MRDGASLVSGGVKIESKNMLDLEGEIRYKYVSLDKSVHCLPLAPHTLKKREGIGTWELAKGLHDLGKTYH